MRLFVCEVQQCNNMHDLIDPIRTLLLTDGTTTVVDSIVGRPGGLAVTLEDY